MNRPLAIRIDKANSYLEKIKAANFNDFTQLEKGWGSGNKKQVRNVEGIAVIPIRSFITSYFDFYCWLFEGVAVEDITAQVESALADESIKGILFDIDSPGGEIVGVNALSDLIFKSRIIKPIVSYVAGDAASAAYWIGASASLVVADETSLVGSIGVIVSYSSDDGKTQDFISSVSPDKRPNLSEDSGRAMVQKWVDESGEIFVKKIAQSRGVTREDVLNNFGAGDVQIASTALENKMIDKIGNFRDALALVKNVKSEGGNVAAKQKNKNVRGTQMSKIFAKISKSKKSAELVIVDTETEGAVIPEDAIPVSEIDAAWIEQNLPEVFEAIKQMGRDEEAGRQGEITDVDPETEESAAAVAAARKDSKVKASELAVTLAIIAKANPTKPTAKGEGDTGDGKKIPDIDPSKKADGSGDTEEPDEEILAIRKAKEDRKKLKAGK